MKQIIKLRHFLPFYKSIIVLLVVAFNMGAAGVPAKPDNDPITKIVTQSLNRIQSAYESADIQALYTELSADFEGINSFTSTLQTYMLTHKQITLDITIDTILTEKQNATARFHWTKKFMDPSGAIIKQNGTAQFGFIITDTTTQLAYIQGDNPLW